MINSFRERYDFLSNFYEAPIVYKGRRFGSTEAAYQAEKCKYEEEKDRFCKMSPREAKKAGSLVDLRPDWEEVKDQVMYEVCYQKFSNHHDLKMKLLQTGSEELQEGNTWKDYYWGVCNGRGLNRLGQILMGIRKQLREEL